MNITSTRKQDKRLSELAKKEEKKKKTAHGLCHPLGSGWPKAYWAKPMPPFPFV